MPGDATLVYNEITLGNLLTLSIDQTAERDESQTDQTYTKIRVAVKSVFNPDVIPAIEVDDGNIVRNELPAETMIRVRHMLLQPRKSFSFDPCGTSFIGISGNDDANGPTPISCKVTRITPETWEIDYTIETCQRDCVAGASLRPWLSLRWSDTITYNEDWFATRRRTGTLILSSFGAVGGIPDAESYRGLVTPEVPKGYRRKSAEYSLSKDNLKVNFTFADVELNTVLPMPALTLKGRMVVSAPLAGGKRKGELHIRLSGPRGVAKQELVAIALRIAAVRVGATSPISTEKGSVLVGGAIVEILDDDVNAVEISMNWNALLTPARTGPVDLNKPIQLGGGYDWVGQTLAGSDPLRAIGPPTRGTSDAVRLAAAILGDPCALDDAAVADATGSLGTPTASGTDGAILRVTSAGDANNLGEVVQLYSDNGGLYADDGPGTYEDYEITSHYGDDPGVVVAPSTKPGDTAKALQYHARIKTLRVEFTATKTGGPPTIPDPEPMDSNVVYLGGTISPAGVDLASDATQQRYTVSGVLRYAFLDSSKVVVAAPLPPWISRSLKLSVGSAASRVAPDIVFPTDFGADPFQGSGTTGVTPSGGDGAGGDFGGATGDGGGQTIYP